METNVFYKYNPGPEAKDGSEWANGKFNAINKIAILGVCA
jgi:hypothetical protein